MRIPPRILVGCLAALGLSLTAGTAEAAYMFRGLDPIDPNNARAGRDQLHMTVEDVGTSQVKFRFTNTSLSQDPNSLSLTKVYFDADLLGSVVTISGSASFTATLPLEALPNGDTPDPDPAFETTAQFSASGPGVELNGFLEITFERLGSFDKVTNALNDGTLRVGLFAATFSDSESPTGSFINERSDGLTAVPAPAGIVLFAAALPVLGLRRVFRRKTA